MDRWGIPGSHPGTARGGSPVAEVVAGMSFGEANSLRKPIICTPGDAHSVTHGNREGAGSRSHVGCE